MMRFHVLATMRVDAESLEHAQAAVRSRLGFGEELDDAKSVVSAVHVTGTPITTNEGATDDRA